MKIALLAVFVIVVLAIVIVAYYIYFPRNKSIRVNRPSGTSLTFSRSGVSLECSPDRYAANGFDHIEPYMSRLLQSTKDSRSLSLFTPDGSRGVGLDAKDGLVQATLTVEWRKESQREAAIRSFFNSLGIAPTQDYLAGNGGVADATRVLEYPLQGSAADITSLVKRMLQELCGVSPTEALDIAIFPREKVRSD